ncbi:MULTISPECIES: DoxX family protein [Amycolatopsis]|nr:DoxX family protein [Amycolatopsis bullii]
MTTDQPPDGSWRPPSSPAPAASELDELYAEAAIRFQRQERPLPTRVWPNRLRAACYWFLAAEFAVGAVTKFWPGPTFAGPAYSVKFADWGYPVWFRFVVGALEGICAVLLVVPGKRPRFLAAVILVLVLTGAVTTHLVNHDELYQSVAAPTHLVIMAVVGLANWPTDWRDLLRRSPRIPAAAGDAR